MKSRYMLTKITQNRETSCKPLSMNQGRRHKYHRANAPVGENL